jgi:hypothetical protein
MSHSTCSSMVNEGGAGSPSVTTAGESGGMVAERVGSGPAASPTLFDAHPADSVAKQMTAATAGRHRDLMAVASCPAFA